MDTDFITAVLIVGGFFLFICGIFVDGFIREWIAENRIRNSYARKMENLMSENWNI